MAEGANAEDKDVKMDRRGFLQLATAAGLGTIATGCLRRSNKMEEDTRGPRPNLIYVFADQLRVHSTGFGGGTATHTPNLDSFAREGVNFTNAISNTPVCTPYRACMLTGRYAHSCGPLTNFIRLPDEEATFGEILKAKGYSTGYIGKWHLSGARGVDYEPPGPGRHGFDYWSSFAFNHRHNKDHYFEDGPEPIEPEGYQTDSETDRAIRFLDRQNAGKPFCLFLSWGPPHPPYSAWNMPPKYLERYGEVKDVPRSELKGQWQPWQKPITFEPHALTPARENATGSRINDLAVATYYAMTDWVDDCFGRLMKALDERGLADNTIVVFSSDHGEMLGSHDMRGKMVFYDESVRIPFLVRWPGKIKRGTVSDACISSVDFLPTLLSMMGVDYPGNVQGADLSHCAFGKKGPEPAGGIIASYTGYERFLSGWEYRGIRTKRFTYARSLQELLMDYGPRKDKEYKQEPQYFLFDNREDPFQERNVVGEPEYKEDVEELEAELRKYLERTGDSFRPAPEYEQFFVDGCMVKKIT